MAIWVLGLFTAILAVITAKQVNGIRHKIAEVENWAYQNFKECGIDPKRN